MFYQDIDAQNAGTYRTGLSSLRIKVPCVRAKRIGTEMAACLRGQNPSGTKSTGRVCCTVPQALCIYPPFVDGNGRVARLLMNTALIQERLYAGGYPPVLRHEYITLLERAHRDDRPFVDFIAERVLESEKEIVGFWDIMEERNVKQADLDKPGELHQLRRFTQRQRYGHLVRMRSRVRIALTLQREKP
jgi:hypothetical protein